MVWTVHGASGLSFKVDGSGLSISGEGHQSPPMQVLLKHSSDIRNLPARWSVYRAAEASERAVSCGFDVSDVKHYLDAASVKAITKPISIITYFGGREVNPPFIAFNTFLPDAYFSNVWKLAKLIISHPKMSYRMSFGFLDFAPRKVPEHPDLISYKEWLAGRPCISKEDFAFELVPSKLD